MIGPLVGLPAEELAAAERARDTHGDPYGLGPLLAEIAAQRAEVGRLACVLGEVAAEPCVRGALECDARYPANPGRWCLACTARGALGPLRRISQLSTR